MKPSVFDVVSDVLAGSCTNVSHPLLFVLSSCLLALISYVVIDRFGEARPLENWVALVLLSFTQVILTTTILSVFWRIDVGPFLTVQLVLATCALPSIRKFAAEKWRVRPGWIAEDRLLVFTLLGVLLFLGLNLFLAIYVPPNTYDSMTYHLARIAYWMQQQSLEHFYTRNVRQTTFPFNAEILIMHSLMFLKRDFLAGLVQYVSGLGSAAVVYLISRSLDFSKGASLFSACLFLSLPAINLQTTSTQNDLTTAFFMSSAFYFLMAFTRDKRTYDLALSALALGCGLGTKTYAFFLLPSMGLYLLANRTRIRDLLKIGAFFCIASVALAGYCHVLNLRQYRNPFGEPLTISVHRSDLRLATFKDNLVKTVHEFIDFSPFYLDGPLARALPKIRETSLSRLPRVLEGTQDPAHQGHCQARAAVNEDYSWYGLLGFTLLPAGLLAGLLGANRKRKIHAALVLLNFLVLCYFMAWQPALGRFLILTVLLWVPLIGFLFDFRKTALAVALIMMVSLSSVALFNKRKPLISASGTGSVLGMSRAQMRSLGENPGAYFQNTHHGAFNRTFGTTQGLRIGLITTGNYWDYPLFGDRFENTVVHLSLNADVSGFDYVVIQKLDRPENRRFIRRKRLEETEIAGVYSPDRTQR